MSINVNNEILNRIANALERISPPPIESKDLDISDGFVFEANTNYLKPVNQINRIPIDLLNSLLEKTGGDSKEEIHSRVVKLQEFTIDDISLSNKNWNMKYENE